MSLATRLKQWAATMTLVVSSYNTVKPPNNRYVGDEHFVCSEVVLSSDVYRTVTGYIGSEQCVHCKEVVHSSECPLLEVPLYINIQ